MELFLEFSLTIALSILISFILAKLLSLSSTTDYGHEFVFRSCKDVIEKPVASFRKFVAESKIYDCKSDGELGLFAKMGEVDEFGESTQKKFTLQEFSNEGCGSNKFGDDIKVDENGSLGDDVFVGLTGKPIEEFSSKQENFNLQEFLVAGCGSPKIVDDVKIDENEVYREVELVGFTEKSIEESTGKGGCCVCEYEENMVDQSTGRARFGEIEIDVFKDEVGVAKSEGIEVLEFEGDNETDGGKKNEEDGVGEGLFDEEDDWEGIERTELERIFGAAVVFVESRSNVDQISNVSSDVKMQLYGLHKVATEGPCHESRPIALKVSARAKWNAWQRLGNMNPEVAMEQYITLLSRSIPGWMQDGFGGDSKQVFADAEASRKLASDLRTSLQIQPASVERNLDELSPHVEGLGTQTGVQTP